MKVTTTEIPDVLLLEPRVFCDERGAFFETYQRERYCSLGIRADFVQDNFSCSRAGVLRGLHYQIEQPQGKLVSCVRGAIYDVAVDLRQTSPTFGQSVGVILDADSRRQLYIPPGFAHGFAAIVEAEVSYKCTDYYSPAHERTLLWNDPALKIKWPCADPLLSAKDRLGIVLSHAPKFA